MHEHVRMYSQTDTQPIEVDEAPLETPAEFLRAYCTIVDVLTATILNAEAGLNWLSAEPPDLERARQTLNIIAYDGKRAGEFVVRIRKLMKRSPP